MLPEERIAALGFSEADTATLAAHFLDAESRGKLGHGLARIDWLETLPDLRPDARPVRLHTEPGYERWDGAGALGYLTLTAVPALVAGFGVQAYRACVRPQIG